MNIKTTAIAATVAAAASFPAIQAAPAHAEINCTGGGYPAGTGCVGLPPEFGITDAQAEQNREWAKCVATAATVAIPEAKLTGYALKALRAGKAVVAFSGVSCDVPAILRDFRG